MYDGFVVTVVAAVTDAIVVVVVVAVVCIYLNIVFFVVVSQVVSVTPDKRDALHREFFSHHVKFLHEAKHFRKFVKSYNVL